jgi:Cellulase (glycosyl hydrolase family 5)
VPGEVLRRLPVPSQVRGITIAALQNYLLFTRSVTDQIVAAAQGWNVNAIRLQIVQDKLVGATGKKYSPKYMANIQRIVAFALHRHLNVILNAQTELSPGYSANENLPTARDVRLPAGPYRVETVRPRFGRY